MDSLSISTSAGWAPAAPLVVCDLGWTHWLAQVYKKNPSPCKKQQWFRCPFFPWYICVSHSWAILHHESNSQAFFTVGSDVLSETEQLRYVPQKRSRKPLKTPNDTLTERKWGCRPSHSLSFYFDKPHGTQNSLPKDPRALGKISRPHLL